MYLIIPLKTLNLQNKSILKKARGTPAARQNFAEVCSSACPTIPISVTHRSQTVHLGPRLSMSSSFPFIPYRHLWYRNPPFLLFREPEFASGILSHLTKQAARWGLKTAHPTTWPKKSFWVTCGMQIVPNTKWWPIGKDFTDGELRKCPGKEEHQRMYKAFCIWQKVGRGRVNAHNGSGVD